MAHHRNWIKHRRDLGVNKCRVLLRAMGDSGSEDFSKTQPPNLSGLEDGVPPNFTLPPYARRPACKHLAELELLTTGSGWAWQPEIADVERLKILLAANSSGADDLAC